MAEDAPDSVQLIGTTITFVRMGEGSNYELTEWIVEPRVEGPPIHLHHQHNEGFYVMAGYFGFILDGVTTYAKPGTHVLVPMGHEHSFWNAGDRPAKCLLIVSPPGLEGYFRALAAAFAGASGQEDSIAVRKKLEQRYDMEVVGDVPSRQLDAPQEG